MTAEELDQFLKQQATMSARIARKTARARVIAIAYSRMQMPHAQSLGSKILNSLSRPGVAPTQRPTSATGGQTFHFRVTTVSRTSDFGTKLTAAKRGAAAAHEAYIEREGAAEKLGAQFARTSAEMRTDVWEALGGQAYIERAGAAEAVDGRNLASFGNIAENFDDRLAFWRALEAAASKPTTNGIRTNRGNDLPFWDQVDRDPTAPEILRNALPFIPLPANERSSNPDPNLNKPQTIPITRHSDEVASAVLDYFRKHRSPTDAARKAPAVEFDPGRGGRVQTRIIVELPHELSPAQRLKLAEKFCRKTFVEGRDQALPYWCVIHAPDHHNDPRNTHMHIVFAERPAKRMIHPESGEECWDFEIQLRTLDKYRHNRLRRPFEQNTDRALTARSWVRDARGDYATIANLALAASGKSKVYDARTYKAMGIDEKPRERINAKDYIREKKGETTKAGTTSINAQWDREEERLEKRHSRFGASKNVLAEFDTEIARWRGMPNAVWGHLSVHRHEYSVAMAVVTVLRAEKAATAFILKKIQSKLLPPLQSRDEDAILGQDFIRMFRKDLVEKNDEALRIQTINANQAHKALKNAQAAEPRKITDPGFLTGRQRMPQLFDFPFGSRHFRRNVETRKAFDLWQEARVAEIADELEVRSAQAEQIAARKGEVIPERFAQAAQETVSGRPRDEGVPSATQPHSPAPAGASPLIGAAAQAAESQRAPTGEAASDARPADPYPKSFLDLVAYDEAPKRFDWGEKSTKPVIEPVNGTLSPEKRKHGDEVSVPFLSDTGAPIQHRVFSATRIQVADEQAAAVAAANERRKAEREAELDAEREKVRRVDEQAAAVAANERRKAERAAELAAEREKVRRADEQAAAIVAATLRRKAEREAALAAEREKVRRADMEAAAFAAARARLKAEREAELAAEREKVRRADEQAAAIVAATLRRKAEREAALASEREKVRRADMEAAAFAAARARLKAEREAELVAELNAKRIDREKVEQADQVNRRRAQASQANLTQRRPTNPFARAEVGVASTRSPVVDWGSFTRAAAVAPLASVASAENPLFQKPASDTRQSAAGPAKSLPTPRREDVSITPGTPAPSTGSHVDPIEPAKRSSAPNDRAQTPTQEPDFAHEKKPKMLTHEQLRRRALMAAKSRGRGR